MAVFASDSFTGTSGTELPTYSASWVRPSWSGAVHWKISSADMAHAGGSNCAVYNTAAPAGADYSVTADVYVASAPASTAISPGVCGRLSTAAATYYQAYVVCTTIGTTNVDWRLSKRIAGSFTQLGSSVSQTLTVGDSYEIKLDMSGTTIALYKEGAGSPAISTTDSSITADGLSGLRDNGASGVSTGLHIDNFSAEEAGGGSLDITATLGTADASGNTAAVNLQTDIAATLATATASGSTATVNLASTIAATLGTATASGNTAAVDRHLDIAATLASATASGYLADIQTGNDLTITATQGTATASGFDASVNLQTDITASMGEATASGFDASIATGTVIAASYGLASADGYQASVNLQLEIDAALATATASGYAAVVSLGGAVAGVYPDAATVLAGITYGPTGSDYMGTLTYASAEGIAAAVRANLAAELAQLTKVSKIHGVGVDLVVTPTSRTAGDLAQTITTVGETTTVSAA